MAGPIRDSLRAKLLIAVVVCAVLPLAAVGAWLTSTAARSGEMLLQSQLDTTLSRAAEEVQTRWQHRRSDVLLLSTNAPVRASLQTDTATEPPAFVRRAFETMTGVAGVVARDVNGRSRWTVGEPPTVTLQLPGRPDKQLANSSPLIEMRDSVWAIEPKKTFGELDSYVRLDALAPAISSGDAAPIEFIALHDRDQNVWVLPQSLPAALLANTHFTWNGHRWLALKRVLSHPKIDVVAVAQLDSYVAPFEHNAALGAIALAFAALVVIALAMFVTAKLTSSLRQLAVAADSVARGDLETRIEARSDDEVGRVARAFNAMTENIRRMMGELSQREAIVAMAEFAATLAHQLRSPATAMRLDVERALDKTPADSPVRPLLSRSLTQLDRMERAIAGSLRVARMGSAQFASVDMRDPLERAIQSVERENRVRTISIDRRGIPHQPLRVRGDEPALEQLFANVLTNAAQAVAVHGCVKISGNEAKNGHVTIFISDNGDGMTKEVLARAGESFFSTKREGTGLGLVIAKRIANAHGGVLTIDSEERVGTTVRIDIPRAE